MKNPFPGASVWTQAAPLPQQVIQLSPANQHGFGFLIVLKSFLAPANQCDLVFLIFSKSFLTEGALLPNTDEIGLSANWGDVLCWGNQGDLYLDIIRDIEAYLNQY